jgi:hypothetical protein
MLSPLSSCILFMAIYSRSLDFEELEGDLRMDGIGNFYY